MGSRQSPNGERKLCVSIDVERDYRLDGRTTVRGIGTGLPQVTDLLHSRGIPYDLFLSGEIVSSVPRDILRDDSHVALGSHGHLHPAGPAGYMNRWSRPAQERTIHAATNAIQQHVGRPPKHFRAPNFSANATTLSILSDNGYSVDSSVLPGRLVRRWRLFTLLDHRGAPTDPYRPSPESLVRQGESGVLEVPVTANPMEPNSPLGLGYLNDRGIEDTIQAVNQSEGRYVVFLCHSWEMVPWSVSDPVAPWVRRAGGECVKALDGLISGLDGIRHVNMDGILSENRQPTA